jgi:ABC-type antimicrobial peptide transport system permease subunit
VEDGTAIKDEWNMNKAATPLQWVFRLLRLICPPPFYEEIEGDLIEKFHRDAVKLGPASAKRRLAWNAVRFLRPGIIFRNKLTMNFTQLYMLTNYFKFAMRVMLRNKTFSAINIAGLALGMTGAILLFLWIQREFTYDNFHSEKDRIHVAWNRMSDNGNVVSWATTPRVLASALASDYTAVESAVSFANYGDTYLFTARDTRIMIDGISLTDPNFLTMFSFPLLKGDKSTALAGPQNIVLTETFARKLFGDREAFGETLTVGLYDEKFEFTVTGILKDLPANTDFHFEFLLPFQFLESFEGKEMNWSNNSVSTYVMVGEGADVKNLNNEIKDIRKKNTAGQDLTEVFLYPMKDMHLYSRFENGLPAGGRIEIVRMLALLGIFLLATGCINFINLSTARAQKRSKEIGIRKVTGAHRHALITQFLSEAILIAVVAGALSVCLAYFLLPAFNSLVKQKLTIELIDVKLWAFLAGSVLLIGILAGSYPAVYLSSFRPIGILKGDTASDSGKSIMRSALVVFQFGFAVMMIGSVIVIRSQITFVQMRDTGYSSDGLVYHAITGDIEKNFAHYKNELIQSGVALSVTKTSSPITERVSNSFDMQWKGKDPGNRTAIERFNVDEHISQTAGLRIIEGRDMDLKRYPSDSTAALMNETAVRLMGFKNPVGEIIRDNGRDWQVVGVVSDFVMTSPDRKVEPMVLFGAKSWFSVVHIKLNPEHSIRENVTTLSSIFTKNNPAFPFEYHFVDEEYERKFDSLQSTLNISGLFSSLAIVIASIGLLGLSTHMVQSRTKEVGIRKVLGASMTAITKLLTFSMLKPILISIVLFTPLAWLSMRWWLQSFAYRITLHGGVFLIAGLVIVLIAVLTIGVQTVRAAGANPVDSLRRE